MAEVTPAEEVMPSPKTGRCAKVVNLLKIHLNEGVTYLNLVIFFLAVSFSSIALLVFADASLGFVLLQALGVHDDPTQPTTPTGSLAGQIVLYSEIVICATIWIWGMLSDRIGRRWVFFAGTLLIAASFASMPFAATFAQIVGIRLVFAPGAAATSAMLMALICDYPRDDAHNKSRGKASAIMGILAGLGAIFSLEVLLKIPTWVKGDNGLMYMFFAAAGVAVVSGLISLFGLAKNLPVTQYEHAGIKELVTSGVKAMKDPYVVLSYLSSFAARGDSSVVTVFLAVWIQEYGRAHTTHTPAELLYHAGMITGVIQAVALVSAPFIGILADKISHALLTCIVAGIGILGYMLLGLLSDPYSWGPQLGFAMLSLGIGEMGLLILSQSILGLHAPIATRGSVSGFWALCGSLGIMFGSGVGGVLYPLNPGSPFFIFAGFNAIVCIVGLILYIRERQAKITEDAVIVDVSGEEKNPLIVQ